MKAHSNFKSSITKIIKHEYAIWMLILISILILRHLDYSLVLDYFRDTPYDFRQTKWGMSAEEVEASETKELIVKSVYGRKTILYYLDEIEGLRALLLYKFTDDKLVTIEYDFSSYNMNPDLGIEDYNRIKENLIGIYGEPEEKNYSESPELIMIGANWETNTTLIVLSSLKLFADGELSLRFAYESKKLKAMKDKY